MKLSVKWRSGRDEVRFAVHRPGGRGGEVPHAFGHNERLAAKGNGDVVVPASEASALVVVKAELAFEVLVRSLSGAS